MVSPDMMSRHVAWGAPSTFTGEGWGEGVIFEIGSNHLLILNVPAGVQKNHLHPFGGTNVHWTFTTTPPHLPQGEKE
jgi:hypothetical protein